MVSVVVPTHNRRQLVDRTLDALAAQTYPAERVEVIVVDDGSDDGTADALDGRVTPWRLRVIRHRERRSAAAARNTGVQAASGDVIAFTDSDCEPVPGWLEALVDGFDDGVGLVQGATVPDPSAPLTPLSRTQWVLDDYGLYETCNIAYAAAALRAAGDPPFRTDLAEQLVAMLGPTIGGQAFGEDTELAWRVRRLGYEARFRGDAVVHHHVFPADGRYLLRRAALAAGFPLLVRRVPELRTAFLHRRVLLGNDRWRVYAALAALLLARRRPAAALLAAPYLLSVVQPTRPGWRARLGTVPTMVACDAVETAALAYGSVRSRSVVL